MPFVITLVGYTPSPRYPPVATPWTQARIAYSATAAGTFVTFDTLALSPLDSDPTLPQQRNLTSVLAPAASGWFQVTFVDGAGNQEPTSPISYPYQAPSPASIRARVETDLSDTSLQSLIDEANGEITARYGPPADSAAPITLTLEGRTRKLMLGRPLDIVHLSAVSITEYVVADPDDVAFAAYLDDSWPNIGETAIALAANDFRVWHGGRTIERLFTGTHPRVYWGQRADITYVPVDDSKQRDEVATKLVILALAYEGVVERDVGDVRTVHGLRSGAGGGSALIYADERERLLQSLQPRRGLMLR